MLNLEQIQGQLDELEKIGQKKGYISLRMIEGMFPESTDEMLDDLETYFNNKGIELTKDDVQDDEAEGEMEMEMEIENLEDDLSLEEDLDDEPNEDDLILEEEAEIKLSDFDSADQGQFQTDDIVRLYLHEIGAIPLLDGTQETQLATQVQKGLSSQEKLDNAEKNGKELSKEEMNTLRMNVARGEQAKEKLINSNLRLVVAMAKRHVNRGLSLADLIQEGNFGLIKAVTKFDPTRGFKFSTYATWWIKQAIQRSIADKGRNVRIPVHMHENINQLAKARRRLTAELHRDPTVDELAQELKKSPEKIIELQRVAQDAISFDTSVGDEDDSTLMDLVPDENTLNPLQYTEKELFNEKIDQVLRTLTPREEMVVRLRHGIGVDRDHTLEEVGRIMNVTRERVRQIEAKALIRLRHHQEAALLKK